jgi:hypothetical protein
MKTRVVSAAAGRAEAALHADFLVMTSPVTWLA